MALQGTLKVRTEELTQQAGTVKTQIDRMESGFDALKQLVDGTTNFWIGEAGEHHRGMYQNKLGQIETILRRVSRTGQGPGRDGRRVCER